jgi:hypothetical protein
VFRECRCRLHLRNSDSSSQHRSVIVTIRSRHANKETSLGAASKFHP